LLERLANDRKANERVAKEAEKLARLLDGTKRDEES
jgi:hypothetical protein